MHLTHYYRAGTEPFRTLSALPEAEALRRMGELYVAGSLLWDRFAEPRRYLAQRRHTEHWLRSELVAKGGRPQDAQPIYFVLGTSAWLARAVDAATASVSVPLSRFTDDELSFTVPDSMVSLLLASQRDAATYDPRYHGKVFVRSELLALVAAHGMPAEDRLPPSLPPYVEAQVWNRERLRDVQAAR